MKPPAKKATPPTKVRQSPKKTPAAAPMPGAHTQEDMKYRAQDALHTLRRADEIKGDPALMHHVKQHAKEQREHLNKVIRRK